jgi:hypothetical protein
MTASRRALLLLAVTLALIGPAPAVAQAPVPDVPVSFIRIAQLRPLLARGDRVVIVDVRSRAEFLALRIRGAVSIPLNELDERAGEVPREGLVVLY